MGGQERAADRGARHGRAILAELGRELRAARMTRGLSQQAVARATGLSRSTIQRIEAGAAARDPVPASSPRPRDGRPRPDSQGLPRWLVDPRRCACEAARRPAGRPSGGHALVARGPAGRPRRRTGVGRAHKLGGMRVAVGHRPRQTANGPVDRVARPVTWSRHGLHIGATHRMRPGPADRVSPAAYSR